VRNTDLDADDLLDHLKSEIDEGNLRYVSDEESRRQQIPGE
jgi:hypothetical protein